MDSLIHSLNFFKLTDNGLDDIISKLNILSTEDQDYEWDTLLGNYEKLKYFKSMESRLINSNDFVNSLSNFMDKIDTVNQHYLREINWLLDTDILEESKIINLLLYESLNYNHPFKKLEVILRAYDILVPIIKDFRNEK